MLFKRQVGLDSPCSLHCVVYDYVTGFGGALTTAGFAFSGSERSAHSLCTPRHVGCESAGARGCGGVPPKGGEPLSVIRLGVGGSAATPGRGRLTPLGLAGGWGAVCPGLVPWGLPGSKHRPRGGLGTCASQWGAEPLAAEVSTALDSAFSPRHSGKPC